jgi:hypothetical protein
MVRPCFKKQKGGGGRGERRKGGSSKGFEWTFIQSRHTN